MRPILNPTPVADEFFGISVAGFGADRILVGAYKDATAGFEAGAAYMFDCSTGALLQTFLPEAPAVEDWFGFSLAAMGSSFLLGAVHDDAGGTFPPPSSGGGAVYLFTPCGDSVLDPGEQCDDGNTIPGDGCDETCQRERASCCDNPNVTCNSDAACPGGDTCCLTHCDSGPEPGCDGLGSACSDDTQCDSGGMCCPPVCGNGFVELDEECDENGNNGGPACACSTDCKVAGLCTGDASVCGVTDADCATAGGACCGNGIVTSPEECDDKNRVDDDGCSNQCTTEVGVPACPGFVGPEVVQATVKRTKLTDQEPNQIIERWKTKGSFILSGSQAKRFDPERQNVQVRFAERDQSGNRVELWTDSPVIEPDKCTPDLFCFPRSGRATRFRWKFKDPDESSNPGVRKGRFKQRDNELKFLFDGRTATIAAPADASVEYWSQDALPDALAPTDFGTPLRSGRLASRSCETCPSGAWRCASPHTSGGRRGAEAPYDCPSGAPR